MKNIFKISIVSLFIIITANSCQTDVSLVPDGFRPVTFTTEAQLDAQMASLYSVLATDPMYAQGLWGYLVTGTDEGFRSGVTATSTNQPALYNGSYTDAAFSNLWRGLYQGIERANIILYVINQPQMSSETKRKAYKGEALFLRAFYYYLLVTNFGDVPLKPQISDKMGTDFNLARSSAKDVYKYILNDMMAADSLVKKTILGKQTPSIVSQTAVQSMITRVCLSMAGNPVNDFSKYQDALTWAQKVINSGSHDLNVIGVPSLDISKFPGATATPAYSRVFINNMQNDTTHINVSEDIFEAAFLSKSNTTGIYTGTGYPVVQQLGATMGVTCPDAGPSSIIGYSGGTYKAFPKLYKLYGLGDTRRDWALAPYIYKSNGSAVRTNFITVTFSGGGGTGAMASASCATGVITQINVDNPGSGYTTAPTVTISGSAGSGAKATATVSGGMVTAINVSVGGTGYPTAYDRPVGKWRREYEINLPPTRQQNFTSCNFPIIRYADVLLMAAEADLMINGGTPSAQAVEYYNQVRRRAYGSTTYKTAMPGVDVSTFSLQDMKDERSRELCFEGLRRQDLIRWGDMTKVMQNVITDNAASCPSTYLTAANMSATNFLSNPVKYTLFPIPYNEMLYDKVLIQNTGW